MRGTLLVVALLVTACMPPHVTKQGPPIGDQPGGGDRELPTGLRAPRSEAASKKVSAKEEPNILVAADRSRCSVSEQKYRETSLGESVFCAWSKQ